MKKQIKALFINILKTFLTISIIFLIFQNTKQYFIDFSFSSLNINIPYFLIAILIFTLYLLSGAMAWIFITIITDCNIAIIFSIFFWFISILGKYIPGKAFLWGIRFYYYKKHNKSIKINNLLTSGFIEYFCGIIGGLILVILSLLLIDAEIISNYIKSSAVIILILCFIILNPKIFFKINSLFPKKIRFKIKGTQLTRKNIIMVVSFYIINWLILGFSVFFVVKGIQPDIGFSNYLIITSSYAFAGIVGFLAIFAPSGIGVREGVFIGTISSILPVKEAVIVAITIRLISIICEIACSLLSFVVILMFYSRYSINTEKYNLKDK